MQKLLDAFNASRSLRDAKRLVSYENKHPFAVCFLSPEQTALLALTPSKWHAQPHLSRALRRCHSEQIHLQL